MDLRLCKCMVSADGGRVRLIAAKVGRQAATVPLAVQSPSGFCAEEGIAPEIRESSRGSRTRVSVRLLLLRLIPHPREVGIERFEHPRIRHRAGIGASVEIHHSL